MSFTLTCGNTTPKCCAGKANADKCNVFGQLFGIIEIEGELWGIVVWEDEEEPSLYKADCILVEETVWQPLIKK